jgi:hypothetical protein
MIDEVVLSWDFVMGKIHGGRKRPRCHPEPLRKAEVAWFWVVIGGSFLKLCC